jgi:hypothetical protein
MINDNDNDEITLGWVLWGVVGFGRGEVQYCYCYCYCCCYCYCYCLRKEKDGKKRRWLNYIHLFWKSLCVGISCVFVQVVHVVTSKNSGNYPVYGVAAARMTRTTSVCECLLCFIIYNN